MNAFKFCGIQGEIIFCLFSPSVENLFPVFHYFSTATSENFKMYNWLFSKRKRNKIRHTHHFGHTPPPQKKNPTYFYGQKQRRSFNNGLGQFLLCIQENFQQYYRIGEGPRILRQVLFEAFKNGIESLR